MAEPDRTKPQNIGRFGARNMYLGPSGSAMRYPEALAACRAHAQLRCTIDAEIAYAKETGLGDHGKITRLLSDLAVMEGRNHPVPWRESCNA